MNDDYYIHDEDYVTVTMMNNIYELQYLQKSNNRANITKINSDEYKVNATGEVRTFNKIKARNESENSLKQTFKRLRYLINTNFTGGMNELFITLTFSDESISKNISNIYLEFNKFMKRLKYKYGADLEYITVIEPHDIKDNDLKKWHGFHLHVLLKKLNAKLFIHYSDLVKIWGLGYVEVKRLNDVDNIGAYLSAYLTNIQEDNDDIKTSEKKYVKGSRLWLYPKGVRIYRKSKGINNPKRIKMTYKDAKEMIGVAPHFKKSYFIETHDFSNIIIFEQYNRKRRK